MILHVLSLHWSSMCSMVYKISNIFPLLLCKSLIDKRWTSFQFSFISNYVSNAVSNFITILVSIATFAEIVQPKNTTIW